MLTRHLSVRKQQLHTCSSSWEPCHALRSPGGGPTMSCIQFQALPILQSPHPSPPASKSYWYDTNSTESSAIFATYRKSLNRSRGSDLIVPIKGGTWIQAGFQKLVNLLSKRLCIVYWAKHMVIGTYMLPAISLLKCGCTDTSRASNRSRASIKSRASRLVIEARLLFEAQLVPCVSLNKQYTNV